ncbi:MAG: hypothetical protein FJX92_08880 [Bacteroidetes bacterium]|nr:hypothetical protein [Bacteroidota bacterium]
MQEALFATLIDDWKSKEGVDRRGDEAHFEIAEFLTHAKPQLPKEPDEQFSTLAYAFLNGVIGLTSHLRRSQEYEDRLWITKPAPLQLQEANRFFRVANNLSKLLRLGRNIQGLEYPKACIRSILDTLKKQPLMIELELAGADYVECIFLMGMIDMHFDGQEYFSLQKIAERYELPKSYVAKITNRIHSSSCTLITESFVNSYSSSTLHYTLSLHPKTVELLVNPHQYYERC